MYTVSVILKKLKDDRLHLKFMSGEPTDIVYDNSDNQEILSFGINNYNVDIVLIRNELRGDRDSDCTAVIDFDLAIET